MSYRRHTASSSANSKKKTHKWTGALANGMSTLATEMNTQLYRSQNALPPDEQTITAIQNWLKIPVANGASEEALASTTCAEEGGWTDPQFPPDATSLYVDPTQQPADAPEKVVWQRVKGNLFVPSSHGLKISEGIKRNRWFLGALAAVATRPDLLVDLIVSENSSSVGIYTFQFYKHGCWHQVVVDNHIPLSDSGDGILRPLFPSSSNQSELWPVLVQKAYAKLHGGYSAIIDGRIQDALVDLTGGVCEKWKLEEATKQEDAKSGLLFSKLVQFCSWGYVMSCTSKSKGAGNKAEGKGKILLNHPYSIVACQELQDGTRLIKLHNCWTTGNWTGAWCPGSAEWKKSEISETSNKETGFFWMEYRDFTEIFNRIFVNRLFPPFWHQLTLHCGWHGTAAGGPYKVDGLLSSTWACNPQFRITSRKPSEVLLCLQQKDPQITNGSLVSKKEHKFRFGLIIFRVPHDFHSRLWDLEDTDVMHDTGLTGAREVAITVKITPTQPIMAIPYARYQGEEGPFVLRSFSSGPIEIEQMAAPLALVVSGHWHTLSSGGSRHNPTWGSNPQYMLSVQHKTTAVISVSRPDIRHAIIPPKFSKEEEINLIVSTPELTDEGLGCRLGIWSNSDIVSETDSNRMDECVTRLILEPETPYLLVPSLSTPNIEAPFELRLLSGVPIELTPLPQRKVASLFGDWTEELSGGCNLNPSWSLNPKFLITTTKGGKFKITLMRKTGPWKRNQSLDSMIGFYILRPEKDSGKGSLGTVLAETPFVPEHTTTTEYQLQSDALYTVMPTTYSPRQLGSFTISVSSTQDFTFT